MGIFIGLISGFINGLFGAGAGLVVLPGLVSVFKLDEKTSRGTALFVLIVVSFITSFFYVGNITDFKALWYIIAGGILGGTIGSKWAKKVSENSLKLILGVIMIITGIKMLIQ